MLMSHVLQFLSNVSQALASKIFYSILEGYIFLFSKPGATVILAAEALLLLNTAGPSKTLKTAFHAAAACVIGRTLWAFSHAHAVHAATTAREQEQYVDATEDCQPIAPRTTTTTTTAAAATIAQPLLSTMWDWEPPTSDPLASGAWHIIKKLALTATTLQSEYPHFFTLLSKPQLTPPQLYARLHFYSLISQQEECGIASYGIDDGDDVVQASDTDLHLLRAYRPFACFAYDLTNDAALHAALESRGYSLIAARYDADVASGCPAYYIAIRGGGGGGDGGGGGGDNTITNTTSTTSTTSTTNNNNNKEVLIAVRGTYSPEDIFTDLIMVGEAFGRDITPGTKDSRRAHAGMAKAATFLASKFGTMLCALRDAGYTVTIVGHSLGAGVSSLLALQLMYLGFTKESLRCFAFEPPACMDSELSTQCSDVVLSLVNEDDIVPRMAMPIFTSFLKELIAFDWREVADKDDVEVPASITVMEKIGMLKESGGSSSKTMMMAVNSDDKNIIDTTTSNNNSAHNSSDTTKQAVVAHTHINSNNNSSSSSDDDTDNSSEYVPCVPGKVLFICLPPNESDGDEKSVDAKRVMIHPSHPLLKRIRISPRMVSDHFIDSERFMIALGSDD